MNVLSFLSCQETHILYTGYTLSLAGTQVRQKPVVSASSGSLAMVSDASLHRRWHLWSFDLELARCTLEDANQIQECSNTEIRIGD
jgi:hypothetical protein